MKISKKSDQQIRRPEPVPTGFKQVTYYDENNQQRTAIVPDMINVTFRSRSSPFKLLELDKCSIYTYHSAQQSMENITPSDKTNNFDNTLNEIIDSYTACLEYDTNTIPIPPSSEY